MPKDIVGEGVIGHLEVHVKVPNYLKRGVESRSNFHPLGLLLPYSAHRVRLTVVGLDFHDELFLSRLLIPVFDSKDEVVPRGLWFQFPKNLGSRDGDTTRNKGPDGFPCGAKE